MGKKRDVHFFAEGEYTYIPIPEILYNENQAVSDCLHIDLLASRRSSAAENPLHSYSETDFIAISSYTTHFPNRGEPKT